MATRKERHIAASLCLSRLTVVGAPESVTSPLIDWIRQLDQETQQAFAEHATVKEGFALSLEKVQKKN